MGTINKVTLALTAVAMIQWDNATCQRIINQYAEARTSNISAERKNMLRKQAATASHILNTRQL